jgi:hypothetical protein
MGLIASPAGSIPLFRDAPSLVVLDNFPLLVPQLLDQLHAPLSGDLIEGDFRRLTCKIDGVQNADVRAGSNMPMQRFYLPPPLQMENRAPVAALLTNRAAVFELCLHLHGDEHLQGFLPFLGNWHDSDCRIRLPAQRRNPLPPTQDPESFLMAGCRPRRRRRPPGPLQPKGPCIRSTP